MSEQTSRLLTWWLRLSTTWRASNHQRFGWKGEELTACCTWPCTISLPPAGSQLGWRVLRIPPGQSHPNVPCASGARDATQGCGDRWVSSSGKAMRHNGKLLQCPQNEFLPPDLDRMKIIPYSYTINTNITLSLQFFQPWFCMKSKSKWAVLKEIFTPSFQSRNLLWLNKKTNPKLITSVNLLHD